MDSIVIRTGGNTPVHETLVNPVKRAVLIGVSADFECRCGHRFGCMSDAEVIGEFSAYGYCPDHPDERYAVVVVRVDPR